MSITFEVLESEVLRLSTAQRALLLDRLVASLEQDQAWEEAWSREADRREAAIAAGESEWLSGPDVVAQLRADLA